MVDLCFFLQCSKTDGFLFTKQSMERGENQELFTDERGYVFSKRIGRWSTLEPPIKGRCSQFYQSCPSFLVVKICGGHADLPPSVKYLKSFFSVQD